MCNLVLTSEAYHAVESCRRLSSFARLFNVRVFKFCVAWMRFCSIHIYNWISSALYLLMRPACIVCLWTQTPVSGFIVRRFKVLKSTSFATKESDTFQVNFSEFNNRRVAAFTTNGVGNSVSFHCLTFFFLLWMLKNTFTTFPLSSQVFWCLEHTNNCFIFPKLGLKYPEPLQSLLSSNQVNILKDKILIKM